MSSFIRRMQRRALRASPDYEPKPQFTTVFDDGSYSTLHPTKGWRFYSARRLSASRKMAHMLDHVLRARTKKAAKVWRKPAAVPPATVTRQQRRYAARKGIAL